MRVAGRVLAVVAGALLLLPLPFVSVRGTLLTALGISLAVLVQLRRRKPLRKRVILVGAVLGAAVAAAVGMGPAMMSATTRRQTPEQEARARAEAIKLMPPGWREIVAAQPQTKLSPGAERAMGAVGALIGIEVLAFVIGAYVAGGVCLCLYGLFGDAWRRSPGGAPQELADALAE